jgi:parallel beta-helix repeat protein
MGLAPPAEAVSFRYASSSNRIYVENGGTATLTAIKAALPNAPLELVDAGAKVWLLSAELYIEDGSVLELHGAAVAGDVNELRLESSSSGFVQVTADYGDIDILSTRITSWNGSGPDTNHSDGRAFIRVRSKLAADGVTPLESRMDIVDSEVAWLGYYAAESYGLVWKVIGSALNLYDLVQVRGNIVDSNIHHNYFGIYTFGHQDGMWTGNQVHDNVQYGFDPHDDSDDLLIEDNDVYDNGNHGIIASKRCDHVIIRNNRSYSNAGNGIMLHRSSNDGLVEQNETYLNGDSGIALFASARTLVRNNTVLDNDKYGIRLSMGAADNDIRDNQIGNSGQYGIYFYRGSDTPEPGDDGRPKRNVFTGNTVHDSAAEAIKMGDGDDNRFVSNVFQGNGAVMRLTTSRRTEFRANTVPTNVTFVLAGTASIPSDATFIQQSRIRLQLDSPSTARFTDAANAIFDPDEPLSTTARSSGGSDLALTSAAIASTTTVFRHRFFARPDSGSVAVNPTAWETSGSRHKAWTAQSSAASQNVTYSVGDLAAGVNYVVRRGGTLIGTFVAGADGRIAVTTSAGTTAQVAYTVDPA